MNLRGQKTNRLPTHKQVILGNVPTDLPGQLSSSEQVRIGRTLMAHASRFLTKGMCIDELPTVIQTKEVEGAKKSAN